MKRAQFSASQNGRKIICSSASLSNGDFFLNPLLSFSSCHGTIKEYLSRLEQLIIAYILPVGLVIQITGIIWLGRGSSWATQTYLWLILPSFVVFLINIKKITTWRPIWAEIFLLMFLVWAFLSKGWSNTTLTWADVAKRCIFISLYIYAIIRLGETPKKLQKCLLFCCFIAACAALLSLIYHYGVEGHGMLYRQYRIFSFQGRWANLSHPVVAAMYYSLFLILLLHWQQKKFYHQNMHRLLFCSWAGITILILYIVMTWSRGPGVAVLVGIFISMVIYRNKMAYVYLFLSLLVIMFIMCVNTEHLSSQHQHADKYNFTLKTIIENMFSGHTVIENTFGGRTNIWKTAVLQIIQRPWLGHGFDSAFAAYNNWGELVDSPHNYFLHVLYLYGVVGILLFISMLVGMAGLALKSAYRHHLLMKTGVILLIVSLIAMLNDIQKIITRPNESWLYIWLPVGMILSVYYQQKGLIHRKEEHGL
ncbi:MAG: O-antigen ligase family protein [Endozoicomonadaceae bacterium]|nr:O-antigen ligase family protein [Endozoicomonadaceae bacterium]